MGRAKDAKATKGNSFFANFAVFARNCFLRKSAQSADLKSVPDAAVLVLVYCIRKAGNKEPIFPDFMSSSLNPKASMLVY